MPIDFEDYLKRVQLQRLLKALGAGNPAALAKTLQHFTTKEAEKRDEIVVNYFGKMQHNQHSQVNHRLLVLTAKASTKSESSRCGRGLRFLHGQNRRQSAVQTAECRLLRNGFDSGNASFTVKKEGKDNVLLRSCRKH